MRLFDSEREGIEAWSLYPKYCPKARSGLDTAFPPRLLSEKQQWLKFAFFISSKIWVIFFLHSSWFRDGHSNRVIHSALISGGFGRLGIFCCLRIFSFFSALFRIGLLICSYAKIYKTEHWWSPKKLLFDGLKTALRTLKMCLADKKYFFIIFSPF